MMKDDFTVTVHVKWVKSFEELKEELIGCESMEEMEKTIKDNLIVKVS